MDKIYFAKQILPLSLPGHESKGWVEKPAHLRQRPLLVDPKEEVW